MTAKSHITAILLFSTLPCLAALQPMDDSDLEAVSGQLGIVLNDVKIIADPSANLQLSFDTDVAADGALLDNVSVVGSGNGANCDPWNAAALPSFSSSGSTACNGVSVGTSTNPISFDVKTDLGVTYLELALPGGVSGAPSVNNASGITFNEDGWQSGIDLNFRLVVYGQGFDKDGSGVVDPAEQNGIFADTVWVRARDVKLPGTYVRAWGNNTNIRAGASGTPVNGGDDLGVVFTGNINGSISELSLDFANSRDYNSLTNTYEAFAPNASGDGPRSGSGSFAGNADGDRRGVMQLSDVRIANFSLGVFPYLPLYFGSIDNGSGPTDQPGFFVEIPMLPNVASIYNDFYQNVHKTDISVGSLQIGTGAGSNIGSGVVTGLRVQHLRVEIGG